MSQVRPLGRLKFAKSVATDVVAYNLYGVAVAKNADGTPGRPPALDYAKNLLGSFPAPAATEANVVIDLAGINGLAVSDGQTYEFAVASVDSAGNISDFSASITHPLDQTPPDAPTGLVWEDATVAAIVAA